MKPYLPHTRAALSVAILTSGFGLASPSFGQGFTLEEVVVTARKRQETLQDVPVAVTNFNAEELQALNLTDTSDLAKFTPGVFIEANSGGGGNGTVAKTTIRGQHQSDILITLDPSVGWYIDDVYLARPMGTVNSLFDAERVEILKGPQGTLYGRNTTGGTIKVVTTKADPSDDLAGYVTGGLGNFGHEKLGAAVNIPLVPDVLAVRLTALTDDMTDGYGKVRIHDPYTPGFPVVATRDAGEKDADMYRIGVTWLATDDLTIQSFYEHSELWMSRVTRNVSTTPPFLGDTPGPGGFVRSSSDFFTSALNLLPEAYAETRTFSLSADYAISDDLSSKLVLGWRDVDSWYNTDIDGLSSPITSQFRFPFTQTGEQVSVEWQINGTAMDGALDWMTGVYWFEEDGEDFSSSFGNSPIAANAFWRISRGEAENASKSVFFSGTLHLTERLNFTGGLRYTKDDKPITVQAQIVAFPGDIPGACQFALDAPNIDLANCTWSNGSKFEFISWNAGFDYAVNDDVMTYIKAASSSRSGGQNLRGLNALTTQPFAEETATDVELGVKGQFFDNALQVNAAYYHTFYEDIQQSQLQQAFDQNGVPLGLVTAVVNTAEADIDGVEVELKWIITEQLMLSATAGKIDWDFDDSNSFLPATPSEEFTARVNYMIPADYGQWILDLNYSYRSELEANLSSGRPGLRAFPAATIDSLSLWGARVSVDIESMGLNVALWGRNLTDEEYTNTPLNLFFPPSLALANAAMEMPRSYGLEATYRF